VEQSEFTYKQVQDLTSSAEQLSAAAKKSLQRDGRLLDSLRLDLADIDPDQPESVGLLEETARSLESIAARVHDGVALMRTVHEIRAHAKAS
jgi:hypothetical protein